MGLLPARGDAGMRALAVVAALVFAEAAAAQAPIRTCAAPKSPDKLCLPASAFVRGPLACLVNPSGCSATQRADLESALCDLGTKLGELEPDTCFSTISQSNLLCPKQGHYVVWRNVRSDVWVRWDGSEKNAPEAASVQRAVEALASLGQTLERVFGSQVPKDAYGKARVQITPTSIYYNGRQCLPLGLSLGVQAEGGRPAGDFGELIDEGKGHVEAMKQADGLLTRCLASPTAPVCRAQAEAMRAKAIKLREEVGKLAQAEAQLDDAAPAPDKSGVSSNKEAGATSNNSSAGGAASKVEGSGGVLPPGAPPWLADFVDMGLTYLGISEVTKGAALAMLMLAPDVLNQLASISAGLTKDLANENLDKAFAAIKSLYQFYMALDSAMNSLDKVAENAGLANAAELVSKTGAMIDALPKELQSDLIQSMNRQMQSTLEHVAKNAAGIDPALLDAVLTGKGTEAVKAVVTRKAREELTKQASKEIGKQLGVDPALFALAAKQVVEGKRLDAAAVVETAATTVAAERLGVDPEQLRGSISAAASGNIEAAGESVRRAVTQEAARRLGVDAKTLDQVIRGNASGDAIKAAAMSRLADRVAVATGVPGLSAADVQAAIRGEGTERLGTVLLGQLPKDAREGLDRAIAVARGEPLDSQLRASAEKQIRQRLPADMRQIDLSASPTIMARQLIEQRMPGVLEQAEALAKDPSAKVSAELKKRIRPHLREYPAVAALLEGDATAADLTAALHSEAERRAVGEIERAAGVALAPGFELVALPPALDARLRSLPIDPTARRQELERAASDALNYSRREAERELGTANRLASCVDPDSLLTASNPRAALAESLTALAALGFDPKGEANAVLSQACPAGAFNSSCLASACKSIRKTVQERSEALVALRPIVGRQELGLVEAAAVHALVIGQPDLAGQFDTTRLLLQASKSKEPAVVIGAIASQQLGAAPTAAEVLQRVSTPQGLSGEALNEALSGRFGRLGQETLAKSLGPDADLLSRNESARVRAIHARLVSPPLSLSWIQESQVAACLAGVNDCLKGAARGSGSIAPQPLPRWADIERQLAELLAARLTTQVSKLLQDHGQACQSVLNLSLGERPPAPPVVVGADVVKLLRGVAPDVAAVVARRVVCCTDTACSRDQLLAGLGAAAKEQIGLTLRANGGSALLPVISDPRRSNTELLKPVLNSATDAMTKTLGLSSAQIASPHAAVETALRSASNDEKVRTEDPSYEVMSAFGSAALLRARSLQECVLRQDGNDAAWCSAESQWSGTVGVSGTCARRLSACKAAIGQVEQAKAPNR